MEVAAVYLQPVAMEPPGMMRDAKASDIHLEADIKATDKNKPTASPTARGFRTSASRTKSRSRARARRSAGPMMPMVAKRRTALRRQREARRARQVQAQAVDRAAGERPAQPFRPPCRQGNRRGPVVQAVHASNTNSRSPASARREAIERAIGSDAHGAGALRHSLLALLLAHAGARSCRTWSSRWSPRTAVRSADARGSRRQALQDRDQQRRHRRRSNSRAGAQAGKSAGAGRADRRS